MSCLTGYFIYTYNTKSFAIHKIEKCFEKNSTLSSKHGSHLSDRRTILQLITQNQVKNDRLEDKSYFASYQVVVAITLCKNKIINMKKIKLTLGILLVIISLSYAQDHYVDNVITNGQGKGIKFFGSDFWKIHMGTGLEYQYGPVTGYSIKTNMFSFTEGWGWTWGQPYAAPIAALSNAGDFQIAGDFYALGNIGIGTTSPQGKLHVESPPNFAAAPRFSMSSSGTSLTSTNTSLSMFNQDQTTNNWARMHFASQLSNGQEIDFVSLATQYKNRVAGAETADFVIATTGNGVYSEKFRIAGNGNVGIGTTKITDNFKLSVGGKVRAEEIEVSLISSGWADFVFEEDYQLTPLKEVEDFIETNKHLPNVPSAKEVTEKGINLGQMDAILLRKIEELTLYMIALKKENEALKLIIEDK